MAGSIHMCLEERLGVQNDLASRFGSFILCNRPTGIIQISKLASLLALRPKTTMEPWRNMLYIQY